MNCLLTLKKSARFLEGKDFGKTYSRHSEPGRSYDFNAGVLVSGSSVIT